MFVHIKICRYIIITAYMFLYLYVIIFMFYYVLIYKNRKLFI